VNDARYLVVKGCAGLGNRLMTLAWGIGYAAASKRTLVVDWTDGIYAEKGRNAFPDVFSLRGISQLNSVEDIPDLPSRVVYPGAFRLHPTLSVYDLYDRVDPYPVWKRRLVRAFTGGRWKLTSTWVLKPEFRDRNAKGCHRLPIVGPLRSGALLPLASSYPSDLRADVVFGADYLPVVDRDLLRYHLSLRPDVAHPFQRTADKLGIGPATLGIHVRQTDWEWQPSLDRLLGRLRTLPVGTPVFVATDSAAALDQIRRVFPSAIVQEKFLPEPAKGGLHTLAYESRDPERISSMFRESLVDLFLLSRCGTFWCQGGSSFSTAASVFADPTQRVEDWGRFGAT
jgi:hypothetical protein